MKKAIIGVIVVLILVGGGWYAWQSGLLGGGKLPPSEQTLGSSGGGVGIKSLAGGSGRLNVPAGALKSNTKVSIKEAPLSARPDGAVGGFYQIEPHGTKFATATTFTMRLKSRAPRGFTLAYWYPETKKWEDLKTIAVSSTEYRAQLRHLSYVGGHVNGPGTAARASTSGGLSTPVAQGLNSLLPTLDQIEQGQARGDMSEAEENRLWDQAHEQLATVADLAIALAEQNPSLQALQDILGVDGVAQALGFGDLDSRLQKAAHKTLDKLATKAIDECKARPGPEAHRVILKIIELAQLLGFGDIEARAKAIEPKCEASYKIEQTDNVPYTFSMPGIISSNGTQTITSVGSPKEAAKEGTPGWQTSWDVVQDTSGIDNSTFQLNLGGVSSNAINSQGRTTDRTRLLFNLAGVKSGQAFPITLVRIGTYTQSTYTPPQDLIIKADKLVLEGHAGESSSDTLGAGKQLQLEGILQQDLGKDGAIVAFGKFPFSFPGLVLKIPPLRITSGSLKSSDQGGSTTPPKPNLPSVPPPPAGGPSASPPSTKGSIPLPDKDKKPVGAGGVPTDINEMLKQYQDLLKQGGLGTASPE